MVDEHLQARRRGSGCSARACSAARHPLADQRLQLLQRVEPRHLLALLFDVRPGQRAEVVERLRANAVEIDPEVRRRLSGHSLFPRATTPSPTRSRAFIHELPHRRSAPPRRGRPPARHAAAKARFGVLSLAGHRHHDQLPGTARCWASPHPALSKDLALSPVTMGLVFSAFAWTYAAAQIPGGIFLDRFGNRLTYFLSLTLLVAVHRCCRVSRPASTACSRLRLGLGVSEAPCFPANSRIVSTWFPQSERARATSIYTVGEYIGLAFFSPLLFMIMGELRLAHAVLHRGHRRRSCSASSGGSATSEPEQSRWANQRGARLHRGRRRPRQRSEKQLRAVRPGRTCGCCCRTAQIWGASLGQFAGNATLVFFVTWFPTYLATERHMALGQGRLLRGAAVHRGRHRRDGRWLAVGPAC